MLCIVGVFLLAVSVFAGPLTSINDATDHVLGSIGQATRDRGRLPNIAGGRLVASDGTVDGLSSLKRTADCWRTGLGYGTDQFDVNLGFPALLLSFRNVTLDGVNYGHQNFMSKGSSIRLSFYLRNGTYCGSRLDAIEFSTWGNVSLSGKDVTQLFDTEVSQEYNRIYQEPSWVSRIEAYLNNGLCRFDWGSLPIFQIPA